MYPWQPTPPASTRWWDGFKKLLACIAVLGSLAAGIQNYGIVSDFVGKLSAWAQVKFFSPSALDRVYGAYDAQITALCTSPQYADLFKRSPCSVEHINPFFIAIQAKPTPTEAALLHDFNVELVNINNALLGGYRKYGNAKERDYARLTAQNEIERIKNISDVLDGKLSWGQFNKQREKIFKTDESRMNLLKRKHGAL